MDPSERFAICEENVAALEVNAWCERGERGVFRGFALPDFHFEAVLFVAELPKQRAQCGDHPPV